MTPSIGHYRSAYELHRFFANLELDFSIDGASRVPAVDCYLEAINGKADGQRVLTSILETVSDPADYAGEPGKVEEVVAYLNERLCFDELELRRVGLQYKLFSLKLTGGPAVAFSKTTSALDFVSAKADFERAISQTETDPEGAVTSACSTLESVCKCILDELAVPYPDKEDIANLIKIVEGQLNLAPNRPELEPDIKQILGGLSNVSRGIGALRTHSGDAHGKGKRFYRIDSRIARLAVHASSTVSLFLIETWMKRSSDSEGS